MSAMTLTMEVLRDSISDSPVSTQKVESISPTLFQAALVYIRISCRSWLVYNTVTVHLFEKCTSVYGHKDRWCRHDGLNNYERELYYTRHNQQLTWIFTSAVLIGQRGVCINVLQYACVLFRLGYLKWGGLAREGWVEQRSASILIWTRL